MNKQKLINHSILITFIMLMLITNGYGIQKTDVIPITTSSKEALELLKKGITLWENGNIECTQYFEKAIAKDSSFAMGYYYLAFSQSNFDNLIIYLNKALSLRDNVSEGEKILILAAQEEFINNNPTKAKEFYQKLIDTYNKDKRAHQAFGFCYYRTRENEKAIEQFKAAIEIDPNFAPAYNIIGYCYSNIGDYNEAEKSLKMYVELLPNAANPHDSYGEILMKQGKFDESIEEYKKALLIDSNFIGSYIGLGTNLIFKGKADEGRKEFQKVYNMVADNGLRRWALLSIVNSYIYESKYDKAMEELQMRYKIAEKNNSLIEMSDDIHRMADILLEIGKLEEAKLKYINSVELIEKSDLASKEQINDAKQNLLFNEARIALKKDDIATAKAKAEEYKKQAEAGNNPSEMQTYHELAGLIALHEKRYDDALLELQQANQRNPRNLCRMAKAYEGKGDNKKTKEFWIKAANFNEISTDYAFIRTKAMKKLAEM